MAYLFALFLLIFSNVAVCKDDVKDKLPAHNNTAESVSQLLPEERKWLAKHKKIRIAYDGSLPPYSFINDQGQIDGIAVEIIGLISQHFGINFTNYADSNWRSIYKAGAKHKVDVIATMVSRSDRAEWFSFTKPYLTKSLVIVTKQDNSAINNRNDLGNKKIAVVKGYQYGEDVGKEFPEAKLVKVKSMLDSLLIVDKGEADAAILFMGTANYLQAKHQLAQLKIAAFYDRNSANESIAVRKDWPVFLRILQKGLDSLTEQEVQNIFAKWVVQVGVEPKSVKPKEPEKPEEKPASNTAPPVQPITKKVVEIEQKPPSYSIQKTGVEAKAEQKQDSNWPVFALAALVLIGGVFYLRRNQKNPKLRSEHSKTASQRYSDSKPLNPSQPMGDAVSEPTGDLPNNGSHSELATELNIDQITPIHEPISSILVDETINYKRDTEGRFSYLSPSVTNVLGYTEAEFIGNYRQYLTDNPVNQHLDSLIEACIQGQPTETYEIEIHDALQGVRWLEVNDTAVYDGLGHCIGIEGVMRDITTQKLYDNLSAKPALEPELPPLADKLETLYEHLHLAIHNANKNQKSFSLIFLSLERLRFLDGKPISHPHAEVLNEANKRLYVTLRDTDTVVVLNEDKYALILPETNDLAASLIVDKIRKILQVPYLLGVQSIVLDAKAGIAIYPDHGIEPEPLIQLAENLTADGAVEISIPMSFGAQGEESLQLQQDLVMALDECKVALRATSPHNINALHRHSQFSIYYQSRHYLADYSLAGFEALIRWQHPEHGLLLPKDFVGLVKDIGLLDVMTYWIIQQVSFQALAWEANGIRPALMAINLGDLSSKQAVEVEKVTNLVNETGAKPGWLAFSIPETIAVSHSEMVFPLAKQFVAAGFTVAIDNIGSDSPLLTQLKGLPVRIVEIDPAFIRKLSDNSDETVNIIDSIAMMHELGKLVIAKEIETEQQLEILRVSGCDIIQGHLLSRPLPAKEAKELIENLPDFAWYLKQ